MSTLHLRNVPDGIDRVLAEEAEARGLSKNRLAIEMLERGLGLDQLRRSTLIEEIRAARQPVDVDVAELVRESRPGG